VCLFRNFTRQSYAQLRKRTLDYNINRPGTTGASGVRTKARKRRARHGFDVEAVRASPFELRQE